MEGRITSSKRCTGDLSFGRAGPDGFVRRLAAVSMVGSVALGVLAPVAGAGLGALV